MSKSCLSCKIRHFRMKICYGRKKKSGQDEKEEYSRMKRVRSYEENRTKKFYDNMFAGNEHAPESGSLCFDGPDRMKSKFTGCAGVCGGK